MLPKTIDIGLGSNKLQRKQKGVKLFFRHSVYVFSAFGALTLLVGRQEEHPAGKN